MNAQLERIAGELEAASERLGRLRQSLTPELWARRPRDDGWSAVECVAHLNLTSEAFVPLLQQGLDEARQEGRTFRARYRRDVVGWLVWRAVSWPGRFKVKTTPSFVPGADLPLAEVLGQFDRLQAELLALTRAADGLPIHRVTIASPFDPRLRYSIFSALSILPRHQHRHLWQAERAAHP